MKSGYVVVGMPGTCFLVMTDTSGVPYLWHYGLERATVFPSFNEAKRQAERANDWWKSQGFDAFQMCVLGVYDADNIFGSPK